MMVVQCRDDTFCVPFSRVRLSPEGAKVYCIMGTPSTDAVDAEARNLSVFSVNHDHPWGNVSTGVSAATGNKIVYKDYEAHLTQAEKKSITPFIGAKMPTRDVVDILANLHEGCHYDVRMIRRYIQAREKEQKMDDTTGMKTFLERGEQVPLHTGI